MSERLSVSQTESDDDVERLSINTSYEIKYNGKQMEVTIYDLADGKGITTKVDGAVWLDWHDLFETSESARIHLFPGQSDKITQDEKLIRMNKFALAIGALDSLMVPELREKYTKSQLESLLLLEHRLPKAKTVRVETDRPRQIAMYESLGFEKADKSRGAFNIPWAGLVTSASSGELVRQWFMHGASGQVDHTK